MTRFTGVWPALLTPLTENDHIDFAATRRLVDHLVRCGIGGLYVYDITDPVSPMFQQYINLRDFAINPAEVCEERRPLSEACANAGDLEPEGVLFIPAAESPIGVPLVVVTHELSTSTTLYRVDAVQ